MENYSSSFSYPDSTSSTSPREPDFENPPSYHDEQPPSSTTPTPNQKIKLMVSYKGKIKPRSHDNLLSYVGGETKILAVDRNINFSTFQSKISKLVIMDASRIAFKYQLPGEDLDSLISVTNDDDLEHLMHEYERLSKFSSPKPARLRVFLFTKYSKEIDSVTLNQNQSNVDFLFGLDKLPVQDVELIPAREMNRLKISDSEIRHFREEQRQESAILPPEKEGNFNEITDSSHEVPMSMQFPTVYCQPPQQYQPPPVYVVQAPPQAAHQGYYQVMSDQSYGMHPVYSVPATMPSVISPENLGYAEVGYGASGRQVYYAGAPQGNGGGGVVGEYSVMTTAVNGGDGKVGIPSTLAGDV